ncbi:helix-turn-helix domain-containing protein [Aurantimonas sp. C2-6-R+9]|uniref:ArsR/SmtB family transcription factor n=1 Tax=unclassified Aurantimonas TaxID=2638230 RepID=UPI002E17AB0D|nr:helix-turn-helix domain-containing protein [Aurantimonas sp. C2-6-R+9]
MASGAIAAALSIPPTRMSFHLATLERAGLLRSWRDGRHILYSASYEDMRQLLAFSALESVSKLTRLWPVVARGA